MIHAVQRPITVQMLLIGIGTSADAMLAVQRSAQAGGGYLVHSCIRQPGMALPSSHGIIQALPAADVLLLAPSGGSMHKESKAQLFEQQVLNAAAKRPEKIPLVLYLQSWQHAAASHVLKHADMVVHVVSREERDQNSGAVDTFPYAQFTRVPGEGPGTLLDILRKVASRPAQSCCA